MLSSVEKGKLQTLNPKQHQCKREDKPKISSRRQQKTGTTGFEPVRPKASGFQVHPINHSRKYPTTNGKN